MKIFLVETPAKSEVFRVISPRLACLALVLLCHPVTGEEESITPSELKLMSLEELMDIEVRLVSRHPEKLTGAASAVQVITREDIRRSGATTLPQALRLASNLHVAQVDAREWAISARGFNNTAANKLLVMIDGRTVYTPLYSGVFWDAQHVFLEDVERIEVISGPGGTLWGSNAVNGVINIVTAEAEASQGVYFATGAGSYLRDFVQGRYGGRAGNRVSYRIYSQHSDHDGVRKPDGSDDRNESELSQGGFRLDWRRTGSETFTLQGDAYDGVFGSRNHIGTTLSGQDVLGRWTRASSTGSEMQVQAYFDRTRRESNLAPDLAFGDETLTYDLETLFRFPILRRQNVLVGAGFRLIRNDVENFAPLAFLPDRKDLVRLSGFLQDEIALPWNLKLALGAKIEREEYDGWNLQPSARLAYTPDGRHTAWGAVSRAVRTPSRIDVELYAPQPPVAPGTLKFAGSPRFGSERLDAYELGFRTQPLPTLTLSISAFYHRYDDLRSVELPDPAALVVEFRNGLEGESRGAEISTILQATQWWKLRFGYTRLETEFREKPGHVDFTNPRGEWNDPEHLASLHSMLDLPGGFQANLSGYFVASLPGPALARQWNYDANVSWRTGDLEFSLHGRNLGDDQDPEFRVKDRATVEIPRSFYGKVAWRL